jgi:hypothetical protein
MNTWAKADLRRVVVGVTVSSFTFAALLGVLALLGSDFGETQLRVLATTTVVGCCSMLMLCYLATWGSRYGWCGAAGALADLLASVLALVLVWADWDSFVGETLSRSFGVSVVAALTLAQVCLLAVLAARRTSLGTLLWGTVVLAALLAVVVSGLILGADADESTVRFIGIVAILDVLGTLVTIALGVFGRDGRSLTVTLTPYAAARLRALARQTGRPVPDLVDDAVARYLELPAETS